MKKIVCYCWPLLVVALGFIGCEKSGDESEKNPEQLNIKDAVELAALQIDEAVETIEMSTAYSLFQQGASTKSGSIDDAPAVNIYLDDLKGVYAYAPVEESAASDEHHNRKCKSYFERIDDSEWFIIQLPHEKVAKPYQLFVYDPNEAFVNNFGGLSRRREELGDRWVIGQGYQPFNEDSDIFRLLVVKLKK